MDLAKIAKQITFAAKGRSEEENLRSYVHKMDCKLAKHDVDGKPEIVRIYRAMSYDWQPDYVLGDLKLLEELVDMKLAERREVVIGDRVDHIEYRRKVRNEHDS